MSAFDKIHEGLKDALAFSQGDCSRGRIHTPHPGPPKMSEALKAVRQWFVGYQANSGTDCCAEEIALIDAALGAIREGD